MTRFETPQRDDSSEWRWTMRRTMQEVVPGVFLGPYAAAVCSRRELLQQQGVTHIVCVRHRSEAPFVRTNFPGEFHYLTLDILENPSENIIRHFPVVRRFVDGCLRGGGKVLVHGNTGNSRSAALVIAYVMETRELSAREAYDLVMRRRGSVCPNVGFLAQLVEYEPIYKARRVLDQGHNSGDSHNKRSFDESELS